MNGVKYGIALLAVLGLMACDSGNRKSQANHHNKVEVASVDEERVFPFPEVPDSIQDIERRAAYTLLHFWDRVEFNDPQLLQDTVLMEKGMSNFLLTIQYIREPKSISKGIDAMYARASRTPKVYRRLMELAEKYLYEPNSPMRSDEVYVMFVESMTQGNVLSASEKERLNFQKKMASMNALGSLAPDFSVELRSGKKTRLHQLLKGAGQTLLIFYDPECENCHKILGDLASDPGLASEIAEGKMQVVLVDIEDDREAWFAEDLSKYPSQWLTAFNSDGLADKELYAIRATPTIFLLSSDGQILHKD